MTEQDAKHRVSIVAEAHLTDREFEDLYQGLRRRGQIRWGDDLEHGEQVRIYISEITIGAIAD
jgi:hypothetical protein